MNFLYQNIPSLFYKMSSYLQDASKKGYVLNRLFNV